MWVLCSFPILFPASVVCHSVSLTCLCLCATTFSYVSPYNRKQLRVPISAVNFTHVILVSTIYPMCYYLFENCFLIGHRRMQSRSQKRADGHFFPESVTISALIKDKWEHLSRMGWVDAMIDQMFSFNVYTLQTISVCCFL